MSLSAAVFKLLTTKRVDMEKVRRRSRHRKLRREFCQKVSSPLYTILDLKRPSSFSKAATYKKEEIVMRRRYDSAISSLTTTDTSRVQSATGTVVVVAYEDLSERSFVGTLQEDITLVHVFCSQH